MPKRGFALPRGLDQILGFIVLGALILAAGAKTALVVGGLFALGGFGSLADRRRNPFAGLGMIAFGLALAIGAMSITDGENPFAPPPASAPADRKDAPKPGS
jgi:hypothetical protein